MDRLARLDAACGQACHEQQFGLALALPGDFITLKVLAHPNLDELCIVNPQSVHPKLSPLPLGAKWQWMSTSSHGEPKAPLQELHGSVSNGGAAAKALFESPSRTNKVCVRRAANSQKRIRCELTNNALRTHRHNACGSLNQTAPQHVLCEPEQWLNGTMHFDQLKALDLWQVLPEEDWTHMPRGKHSWQVASPLLLGVRCTQCLSSRLCLCG